MESIGRSTRSRNERPWSARRDSTFSRCETEWSSSCARETPPARLESKYLSRAKSWNRSSSETGSTEFDMPGRLSDSSTSSSWRETSLPGSPSERASSSPSSPLDDGACEASRPYTAAEIGGEYWAAEHLPVCRSTRFLPWLWAPTFSRASRPAPNSPSFGSAS